MGAEADIAPLAGSEELGREDEGEEDGYWKGEERIKNFPPWARCKTVLGNGFTQRNTLKKRNIRILPGQYNKVAEGEYYDCERNMKARSIFGCETYFSVGLPNQLRRRRRSFEAEDLWIGRSRNST